MSGTASAWMPFYVGDYLGDTQRLTTEQHGAYLLLILDYWRSGPAPDDDAVLAQIVRLPVSAWKRHRPTLARMFQVVDGEWRHKRIDHEIAAAKDNAERRSNKAKKAAQARWEHTDDDAPGNAPSMPQALLDECPPPSPIPLDKSNGAEPDSDKVFWDGAKSFLSTESRNPGAIIGKWVREHGKQPTADALTRAQLERPVARIPFIEGCFRKQMANADWQSPC